MALLLVNKLDFSQRPALLLHPAHSNNFLFHLLAVVCFNPSLYHHSLLWSSSCLSCSLMSAGGTCLAAFLSSKLAPRWAAMWMWREANAQQGELMWWLWTMCQPQLASPRMRLSLSCCSHCASPETVIKGISLLESQLGMVGLHFVQFSLMTKS